MPRSDFDVFAGARCSCRYHAAAARGASRPGNVNPGPIDRVYQNWRTPEADALQAGITATRSLVQKYPMISALKAIVGHWGRDPDWATVRPPLVELTPEQQRSLVAELTAAGFDMPGLTGSTPP
jgi:4-hydroxy-tetrahydrodipicolinate synthase